MSSVLKPLLTPQEYLTRERKAEFRSEYYRGEMFAMAGASYHHNRIQQNVARHTENQLDGGPCEVLAADMRVKVNASGLYTYPDIIVLCDKPQFEDGVLDTLLNPRVLMEVLSESTEKYDRGEKFKHYRQLPSLQEYVLIAQEEALVERHVRQPDDTWLPTEFRGLPTTLEFASILVRIALTDIYRGVEFPETR